MKIRWPYALGLVLMLLSPPLRGGAAAPTAASGERAAKVFLTVEEALELAFPGSVVERRSVYLTEDQRKRAEKLSKVDVKRRVVFPYVARRNGKLVGTAYFDSHRVRTLKETVMFVVGADRRIRRFELLSFAEPKDYIPRGRWYAQFVGRKLDRDLNLKRGIKGVTGATLTARATTKAARRILALHAVIFSEGSTEAAAR